MPRGPKPKPAALARAGSRTHEYQSAPGVGWQHGPTPAPPDTLTEIGAVAWRSWFASWFASFWTPADLPVIELTAELYERVRLGVTTPDKLTPYLDRCGITVKGRQDNRWSAPEVEQPTPVVEPGDELATRRAGRGRAVS